jgi:hypothetical protein
VLDTLFEWVRFGGCGGLRRERCRRRYCCGCHSWRSRWTRTRYWCRCRCRGWRGCGRRHRWLPMALAKQKSDDAQDGCFGTLPRRLGERALDRSPARREFWLSPPDVIAFAISKSRVVGIRHMNRNFGSLPGTGNRIGKASSRPGDAHLDDLPRSPLFDQYSDFSLPKLGCILSSMSAIESTRSSTG